MLQRSTSPRQAREPSSSDVLEQFHGRDYLVFAADFTVVIPCIRLVWFSDRVAVFTDSRLTRIEEDRSCVLVGDHLISVLVSLIHRDQIK